MHKKNTFLPNIKLFLTSGEIFNLYNRPFSKYTILIFYKGFRSEKCQEFLKNIDKHYNDFQKLETKIYALSYDTIRASKILIDKIISHLIVVAGLRKEDVQKLEILNDKNEIQETALIIDEVNKILYISKKYPKVEILLLEIEKLRK